MHSRKKQSRKIDFFDCLHILFERTANKNIGIIMKKVFMLLCFTAINFCGLQASNFTDEFSFDREDYSISMWPTGNQGEMKGLVRFPELKGNINAIKKNNQKMYDKNTDSVERFKLICANIVLISVNIDILDRSVAKIKKESNQFAKRGLYNVYCDLKSKNEEQRISHLNIITTMKNDLHGK